MGQRQEGHKRDDCGLNFILNVIAPSELLKDFKQGNCMIFSTFETVILGTNYKETKTVVGDHVGIMLNEMILLYVKS